MLNFYKLIIDGLTSSLLASTEGEAGYGDYAFHFLSILTGTVPSIFVGLIVAGIVFFL